MSASEPGAELDRLIKAVPNPSVPSTKNFARLEEWIGPLLGIAPSDVRALYVSKPGNLLVRFRQPGLLKKSRRLGVGILKRDGDLDACVRAAVKLVGQQQYAANMALCTPGASGRWSVGAIVALPGDDLLPALQAAFPNAPVVLAKETASGSRQMQLVATETAPPTRLHQSGSPTDITLELVRRVLDERQLKLPDDLVLKALAALRANKHLLLTGPPGTGKTTFAEVLAESAARAGVAAGWFLATATADWTSIDTVGGYRMDKDGELVFWPGQVLQSVDSNSWLVIDEFNRADIDKSFGQLFTVLSGQAVTLPYVDSAGDGDEMVSIVPTGVDATADTVAHHVGPDWRILATLNTRDRDFLFKLSYALLRRFAVIEVPVPDPKEYDEIMRLKGSTGSTELDSALKELARLPTRRLGPAILLDCAAYIRERRVLAPAAGREWEWICEALDAFVLPQLDDLTAAERRAVMSHLVAKVVGADHSADVAMLLSRRLGVAAAEFILPQYLERETE